MDEMIRKLVKTLLPKRLFEAIEPYGHWGEAVLANLRYGFASKRLKVIGVTGTDGKTTTATLITAMLRANGYKVGMLTTISIDTGDGPEPNPTRLTSVKAFGLQKQLARMKRAGVEWLVLETTSHALAQNRYWGIPYSVAVMTNITHEHLDYHRTFDRYRAAKLKLFRYAGRNTAGLRTGIVNADDPSADLFAAALPNPILYGINGGELRAEKIQSTPAGSTFTVSYQERSLKIICHLPGSFNVYNALAAAGVGIALGMEDRQIEQGIASLQSVEGRMNAIDEGQDFSVIIDYAHTPDSFKKIFEELRPLTKGRLIAVFGSAGRRDKAKRALQGQVAGELCDIVVVTEEDDRDENGLAILHDIADGAKQAGKRFDQTLFEIHDRGQAIDYAINKLAKAGDTVVLLGKGHEKSILSNGPKAAELRHQRQNDADPRRVIKKPWDEAEAVRLALSKRRIQQAA